MRKRDVFGKKINTSKPLFNLIVVFAISLIGYFSITYYQNYQLALLKEEQNEIQIAITNQLILSQENNYQEIESLEAYLPQSIDEVKLYNELILILGLSGITDENNYNFNFIENSDLPFTDNIADNLSCTKINLSVSLTDYMQFFDLLDYFDQMDTIYYIDLANLVFNQDSSTNVSLSVYTFYME